MIKIEQTERNATPPLQEQYNKKIFIPIALEIILGLALVGGALYMAHRAGLSGWVLGGIGCGGVALVSVLTLMTFLVFKRCTYVRSEQASPAPSEGQKAWADLLNDPDRFCIEDPFPARIRDSFKKAVGTLNTPPFFNRISLYRLSGNHNLIISEADGCLPRQFSPGTPKDLIIVYASESKKDIPIQPGLKRQCSHFKGEVYVLNNDEEKKLRKGILPETLKKILEKGFASG